MFCMTNLSYATYNEWFYHPNYLLRETYITMQAVFGQALCLRKSKLYFLSFLANSYCALLPKYMFLISFSTYPFDNGENNKIQRDFSFKLHHMSSACIQCMIRSHHRKHDHFLTSPILNIQVQKEKEKRGPSTVPHSMHISRPNKSNLNFPCGAITRAFNLNRQVKLT